MVNTTSFILIENNSLKFILQIDVWISNIHKQTITRLELFFNELVSTKLDAEENQANRESDWVDYKDLSKRIRTTIRQRFHIIICTIDKYIP